MSTVLAVAVETKEVMQAVAEVLTAALSAVVWADRREETGATEAPPEEWAHSAVWREASEEALAAVVSSERARAAAAAPVSG